ncbi:GAF domain-containing protein [Pseudacidovorax intermedius]|nr:GAF domain-containing protein [Pseudacidovorax intermedius]
MQAQRTTAPSAVTAEFLDMLACAAHAPQALALIDACRDRIAGGGIFSIQQNVTCADDAPGQVLLRRFYSSASGTFPVNGAKRKTLTRWTHRLFVEGRPFIGEGEAELAEHFDDFEQMRAFGLRSVVNVPLMQGPLCYATFNVFGTAARWRPEQVLAFRLLALAAARWVPVAPALSYHFGQTTEPAAAAIGA